MVQPFGSFKTKLKLRPTKIDPSVLLGFWLTTGIETARRISISVIALRAFITCSLKNWLPPLRSNAD
jgi:hypothetical protein